MQVVPQSMPAGLDMTVPPTAGLLLTPRLKVMGSKVAVTVLAEFIATIQSAPE